MKISHSCKCTEPVCVYEFWWSPYAETFFPPAEMERGLCVSAPYQLVCSALPLPRLWSAANHKAERRRRKLGCNYQLEWFVGPSLSMSSVKYLLWRHGVSQLRGCGLLRKVEEERDDRPNDEKKDRCPLLVLKYYLLQKLSLGQLQVMPPPPSSHYWGWLRLPCWTDIPVLAVTANSVADHWCTASLSV